LSFCRFVYEIHCLVCLSSVFRIHTTLLQRSKVTNFVDLCPMSHTH
jgi:hypothetical protein